MRHTKNRRHNPHRRHRRRIHRRRRNPTSYLARSRNVRMYRRRRHNPSRILSGNMVKAVIGTGVGFFGTRMIPATLLKQYNSGVAGYALNAGSAVGLSWLISRWDREAGRYALVGGGVAVLARLLAEKFGVSSLQGDMDFDLGYYVSDRFPFPQGAGGPYDTYPGNPSLLNPPFPATSAAAVRAGTAAAAAALPAAAAPEAMAGYSNGRWAGSRWS